MAFLPVFAEGVRNSHISVHYLSQNCILKIYETKVNDRSLPIIGVLLPNRYERSANQHQTKVNSAEDKVRLLESPIKFEGVGGGYPVQSFEDEVNLGVRSSKIGQQILGLSYEGGGVVDHFARNFETLDRDLRIRFKGTLERGILMIGWTQNSTHPRQDGYNNFD